MGPKENFYCRSLSTCESNVFTAVCYSAHVVGPYSILHWEGPTRKDWFWGESDPRSQTSVIELFLHDFTEFAEFQELTKSKSSMAARDHLYLIIRYIPRCSGKRDIFITVSRMVSNTVVHQDIFQ